MEFKPFKDDSRKNWGVSTDKELTEGQIQLGALLRIADATEMMSKNYAQLIQERDTTEAARRYWRDQAKGLERRVNALRGVITKMKQKSAVGE